MADATMLTSLPNELLDQIVGHLEGIIGPLHSICLTSRRLYEIGNPILYRNILLDRCHRGALLKLIRSILTRQELGNYAKRLSLYVSIEQGSVHEFGLPQLQDSTSSRSGGCGHIGREVEEFVQACNDHIRSFCETRKIGLAREPTYSRWSQRLHAGRESAYGGIIVSLLPEIEELDIKMLDGRGISSSEPLKHLFGVSAKSLCRTDLKLTTLQNIRTLCLPDWSLNLIDAELKGLQRLELDVSSVFLGSIRRSGTYGGFSRENTTLYPNLKELSLRMDWWTWNPMSAIGRHTRESITKIGCFGIERLEILIISNIHSVCNPQRHHHTIDSASQSFDEIITELNHLTANLDLKEFTFDYWIDTPFKHATTRHGWKRNWRPHHFGCMTCMKTSFEKIAAVISFANHRSITRVSVLQHVIVPRDYVSKPSTRPNLSTLFPQSLEELNIIAPDDRVLPWLEDLGDIADQSLPNLKVIQISCRRIWGEPKVWFEEHLLDLIVRFEAMGVKLIVVNDFGDSDNLRMVKTEPMEIEEGTLERLYSP